ncbi:VTT domain-containing protein [Paenibacillus filicis]|uniref:VTT domain-containing protein n=1 Tax=Paenibacillus gyeongsangnamensis TaxID=3388067 RepID=A0ABT4Q8E9_9BACL|nr:VTT domain-containing protein [Paenibacillus filicis]MCZ8513066.1 VTT domain-containing protein [Paenibacillus filicis]
MLDWLMHWIDQHGYIVLFLAPMLELLFLPVSAEVVMGYGGVLVFQGKLNWLISILAAGTGSSIGMTLAYWIGYKLGRPFFERYGSRIHMGPERIDKAAQWFQRYGNKVITINYFITGVRHITGYFSGITRIPFRTFMLYAYIGAYLWAAMFVSLGKLFGPKWDQYQVLIKKYVLIITIIIAVIFVLSFLYKKYKLQIIEFFTSTFKKGEEIFHSLRRVKILVVVTFAVFLSLFVLMIGLIQDFLAKEFDDFDMVTSFIIHAMFDESWSSLMNGFAFLASFEVLVPIVILTLLWIIFKGKDRMLETIFLLIVVIGGEMWDEGLRRLFHRVGHVASSGHVPYTFPSEQTFITLIVLGFSAFLWVRHVRSIWVRYAVSLMVIVVCILVGLSRIFFEVQYPSEVAAGYVFGGVWLSLNVILLEIFRLFKNNKTNFST